MVENFQWSSLYFVQQAGCLAHCLQDINVSMFLKFSYMNLLYEDSNSNCLNSVYICLPNKRVRTDEIFLTKYAVFPAGRLALFRTEFLYRWWISSDIIQQNWSKLSFAPFIPLHVYPSHFSVDEVDSSGEAILFVELLLEVARSLIPFKAFSTSIFVSSRFVNIR